MRIIINNEQYENNIEEIKKIISQMSICNSSKIRELLEFNLVEDRNTNEFVSLDVLNEENEYDIKTNSQLLLDTLFNKINKFNIEEATNTISLNEDYYNILLCDPSIYDEALTTYKEVGFSDIISIKFSDVIFNIEKANEFLEYLGNMYVNENKKTFLFTPYDFINNSVFKKHKVINSLSIAIKLIGELANSVNIKKEIKYYYLTSSKINYFNAMNINNVQGMFYKSIQIDKHVNRFEGNISNLINKSSLIKTVECSFISFARLFNMMGLQETSIKLHHIDDYSKEVYLNYKNSKLKGFVTRNHLSDSQLLEFKNFDFVYILNDIEPVNYVYELEYLDDHLINHLYKEFLKNPGTQLLRRK